MKTALALVAVLLIGAAYLLIMRRRHRRQFEADLRMVRPETIEERARRMGV